MIVVFAFLLIISKTSFAFDLYGWWKSDSGDNYLKLIKIDKKSFCGFLYDILNSQGNIIKISLNYDSPTTIKINSADSITVSYPSELTLTYERITSDTSLSKEAVLKITRN